MIFVSTSWLSRFGLNPHELSWNTSSSNNGVSLVTNACWIILSSIVGIPKGLSFPFFLGMYFLATGLSLYSLSHSFVRISLKYTSSFWSNFLIDTLSMPSHPLFFLTWNHDSFSIFSFSNWPYTLNNLCFNGSFIVSISFLLQQLPPPSFLSLRLHLVSSISVAIPTQNSYNHFPSVLLIKVSSQLRKCLTSVSAFHHFATLIDGYPLKDTDLTRSPALILVNMLWAITPYTIYGCL